ncbi:four-helix bundle copper-binding protein [Desulfoscipio gibsoniae]|uniref:Ferredoxin n=1 Tax=Desulfoscipio gibsoniae DSM 7213 TaxID=767817 RepID=R4KD89_9FIRM|nr:four-helix bundle copper-binding protein [Desulfoscipio gibsoniae]AGL01148.1 hypothetical protein Desgi_1678 [Desulfoscipio gibsoniae DSM 7213]
MAENPTIYSYYPIDTHERVLSMVQYCEAVCENTFTAVLGMCDQSRATQLQLLRDCADICTLTAKYIARCSMYARPLAAQCAQICETCGHHCLKMPDSQSQFCGRVCLDCARECRAFAGMSGPGYIGHPSSGHSYPNMPGMYSQSEKKDENK